MSMHFDLVDLRLMVRIAEANSLTKGAKASHISLPAASSRIKILEESIGTKLLNRTSQGVTLTPPGQAFVHHARTVLGQIQHLCGDLQEYALGVKGHLRVFANTTALGEYLPPVLRSSLKQRIQVGNFEAACRMVEANVGVAILPESVARRHAQTMAIAIVPLSDQWAFRSMKICVRSQAALPIFARELVDLLVQDAATAVTR